MKYFLFDLKIHYNYNKDIVKTIQLLLASLIYYLYIKSSLGKQIEMQTNLVNKIW